MKNITRVLALTVLVLGAGRAPAEAASDCKRGTICRQRIEDGYKDCLRSVRDKWKAIKDQCKRAKQAHDPASCLQAIKDGYQASRTDAMTPTASETTATCPPDYPVDCGDGSCCPSDFPLCKPNICCSDSYPVDCGTFCCPSDYPVCGDDGFCHQPPVTSTTTTTTMPSSCTLPSSCTSVGGICSVEGCLGLPSGGCEAHCSGGGGFACIAFVASYSSCTTDADCPPSDPALHDDTVCIASGFDPANPLACSATYPGYCAQPCP